MEYPRRAWRTILEQAKFFIFNPSNGYIDLNYPDDSPPFKCTHTTYNLPRTRQAIISKLIKNMDQKQVQKIIQESNILRLSQ